MRQGQCYGRADNSRNGMRTVKSNCNSSRSPPNERKNAPSNTSHYPNHSAGLKKHNCVGDHGYGSSQISPKSSTRSRRPSPTRQRSGGALHGRARGDERATWTKSNNDPGCTYNKCCCCSEKKAAAGSQKDDDIRSEKAARKSVSKAASKAEERAQQSDTEQLDDLDVDLEMSCDCIECSFITAASPYGPEFYDSRQESGSERGQEEMEDESNAFRTRTISTDERERSVGEAQAWNHPGSGRSSMRSTPRRSTTEIDQVDDGEPISRSTYQEDYGVVEVPSRKNENFSTESKSAVFDEDEDRLFLLSLLTSFKKMDPERKLQARIDVMQVVKKVLKKSDSKKLSN